MSRPRVNLAIVVAALDEVAAIAEGGQILAELASTSPDLQRKMPLIFAGMFKKVAEQLNLLSRRIHETMN